MGIRRAAPTAREGPLASTRSLPTHLASPTRRYHEPGESGNGVQGEGATVQEIARIISSTLDIDQVYEKFAAEVKKLVHFDRLGIHLIDHDAGTFTPTYFSGLQWKGREMGSVVPLKGTLVEHVLRTGRSFLREDIRSGHSFVGDQVRIQAGLRSSITVPLVNKGRVIGVLHTYSCQLNSYGSREQGIMERLADQIAPAVENARLYESLRRSEAMNRALVKAIPDTLVRIRRDGTYMRIGTDEANAHFDYPNGFIGKTSNEIIPPDENDHLISLVEKTLQTGETQVAEYQLSLSGEMRHYEVRLAVSAENEVLGIYRDITERKQTEDEMKRRTWELGKRVKELTCLYKVSSLSQKKDIRTEELFQGVCYLLPPAWQYPDITCCRVRMNAREVKTENFKETPWMQTAAIVVRGEHRGEVDVCYQEEVPPGDEGPFLREERNLIDNIAEQLGRFAEREESQQIARSVSRKLLHVQEEERRRVARDLHDQIGQQLTGLKLTIDALVNSAGQGHLPHIESAQGIIDDLMGSTRALSTGLCPPMLEEFGLLRALNWLFDSVESQTNVKVDFECREAERRFQPQTEIAVFRVIQESLTNIARHAGVHEAAVHVECADRGLTVEIADRGAGFDVDATLTGHSATGLLGMRQRVELLDGEFTVDSEPGKGTRVRIRLPIQDQ